MTTKKGERKQFQKAKSNLEVQFRDIPGGQICNQFQLGKKRELGFSVSKKGWMLAVERPEIIFTIQRRYIILCE